jgi:multidrug efflux system membrane fusion protein
MKSTANSGYLSIKIIALAIAAAFAGGLAGCAKTEAQPAPIRPALVFKVGQDAGVDAEVYPGEVRSRVEADMGFRIGGKMVARLVDQGATVKAGQPLARLDPQDVRLAADASRANVTASKAEYDFAEAETKRFKTLLDKNFISQSAYDAKVNTRDAAKARYESSQAQAAVNTNQAGYATLVADQDGVVMHVSAEAGQVVSSGQPILRVANPREREVAITVSESRINEFRAEMNAKQLYIWLVDARDKKYPAKVREIGAAADPATRTYPVRVSFVKADDDVKLGMTAYVAFLGATDNAQIAVPLSAIYQQGNKTLVWVVGADNKLSPRLVSVVKYRENAALITGPLKAGEVIVAAGVHKLREGQVVKPVTDPVITGDNQIAVVPVETSQFASSSTGKTAALR